ncbi:MAG: metallophosphoesterase [Fidelibacterota bacterium]|nr:MAG: metallophosphoesterase [Candidatus Neomarinimicrobiota bacterium]
MMLSKYTHRYMLLTSSILLFALGCSSGPQLREEIGPAGNEYFEPPDPAEDDSDQILTEYGQFPDSVVAIIEQILPGGVAVTINHWGPFRYTVTKRFDDGRTNQLFVYLTGRIQKILYTEGRYKERPGLFFVTGTERSVPLDSVPVAVMESAETNLSGVRFLQAWTAESDIGPTYVLDVVGFQDGDTTGFAYRPDGVLKTMSEARRMRRGLVRKWTDNDIEQLLGHYRNDYCVDTVLARVEMVPYNSLEGFRFIVFGDNRIDRSVWELVCKSISRKNAVFAIGVGDLVDDGQPEEYDEDLFGVLEKYGRFNFLPVVGNHDIGHDGLAVSYRTSFGPGALNYYFDYGNARFVILDNCSRVTDFIAQLDTAGQWLAEAPQGYHKFVFVHVPPGDIKKWSYHAMSGEKSRRFTEAMTKHAVDHVFAGHIHAYSTASHNGVDYTITGGAGANLHKQYGPQGSVHHYVIVDVTPAGIQQQVVRFYPR